MTSKDGVCAKNILRADCESITSKDGVSTIQLQRVECGQVMDVQNKQYSSINSCSMCHEPVSNCVCAESPGIGRVTTNSKTAISNVQKFDDAKGGTCQNPGRGGQTAESLEGLENLSHNKGRGAKVTIPAQFSRQDIHFSRQDIHSNSEKNINTQSRGEFNTPTKRRLIQNENTKTLLSVFEVGKINQPEGVGVEGEVASPAKRRKCIFVR